MLITFASLRDLLFSFLNSRLCEFGEVISDLLGDAFRAR